MIFLVIPLMILISTTSKAQNNFLAAMETDEWGKTIMIPSMTEMNFTLISESDPASYPELNKRQMISRDIRNWEIFKTTGLSINQKKLDPILPGAKQFSPSKKWSAGFTVQDYINIQWKEKQFSFDSFLSAECEPVSRIDLTPEHAIKCSIAFKF